MVIAWDLKYTAIALSTLNSCYVKEVIMASLSSIGLKYRGKGGFARKTERNRRIGAAKLQSCPTKSPSQGKK